MGLGIAIALNGTPDELLAGAVTVEVQERMGEATTYRLRYAVDIHDGDLPLLVEQKLDPASELAVLVPRDEGAQCLVKGPVNAQQTHLVHGGAGSWMEVSGTDSSLVMDRAPRATVWSNATDADAVSALLANNGYVTDVEPTDSQHVEEKHVLVQRETDLEFVRRMARRNGFLFWVTCDAQGTETAHFRPPDLSAAVAAQLAINLTSPSVQAIDFTWDVERPTAIVGAQLDLDTLEDIDGGVPESPSTTLGATGLAALSRAVRTAHHVAPADDAGDLRARGNGVLSESGWFLRATCQTAVDGLGALVRAHTVVEIRGAGSRYSGRYFVAGARHTIDAAGHRMDLELVRNGWGA